MKSKARKRTTININQVTEKFFGREKELESIKNCLNSSIIVIYGRRRIGKSSLIAKALEGVNALYFEGLEDSSKSKQMKIFQKQLHEQIPNVCKDLDCNNQHSLNWIDLLKELLPALKQGIQVIVIDEFQWLANYRHELVSEIKLFWDRYISKEYPKTTLILCGSIASFMISKVVRSSALYGRINLEINLKELSLKDSSLLLNRKGIQEVFESYMLLGGVPKYLQLIRNSNNNSVRQTLNQLAFTEHGILFNEFDRIFIGHFKKNSIYKEIVTELVKHPYGLYRHELIKKIKANAGGTFGNCLMDLESSGLIASLRSLEAKENSKILKYIVVDPYVIFYFKFILPNKNKILQGNDNIFKSISQSTSFKSFMGHAFEVLCKKHTKEIAKILGFSGVDYIVGPFLKPKNVEIDLMFLRNDFVITLCEIKYGENLTIEKNIISEVEKRAEKLQEYFPKYTIQKVLISNSVVTQSVIDSYYFHAIINSEQLLQ